MAAFHVNDLKAWETFREVYLEANLSEIVDSINESQSSLLALLSEDSCDQYEIGQYCAFTINEYYKVLSMRGSASAVKNEDKIDNIKIDFYSLLSSCTKAVNAC